MTCGFDFWATLAAAVVDVLVVGLFALGVLYFVNWWMTQER